MISISGDVIYYDNRPVGFITVPNGTLRGDFEEALSYDSSAELVELRSELTAADEELNEAKGKIQNALDYIDTREEPEISAIVSILS